MPDTDSDSSTRVDMSARRPWRTDWMRRRSLPTRRVSQTKNGSSASENTASTQLSANIATIVAATVVTVETVEVAVLVTTSSMPPMSYAIRACTSPERVLVKKASDIRCRCANTAARRSCITCWPTWFEIHVCATLITPVITDRAIIPPTSSESSSTLCVGDRLVDHFTQQKRRDHAQDRGQEDQRQQRAEPHPVGHEQPRHPPQRDGPVGDVLGAQLRALRAFTVAASSLREGLMAHMI